MKYAKLVYKYLPVRTFKKVVQPKIPVLAEINLENDMLATLRPALEARPTPTLAGDPRLPGVPGVPHHKIREEVFEKWCRSSKVENNKTWLKTPILS